MVSSVWYCGNCGDGPKNLHHEPSCTGCGHFCDTCCIVETLGPLKAVTTDAQYDGRLAKGLKRPKTRNAKSKSSLPKNKLESASSSEDFKPTDTTMEDHLERSADEWGPVPKNPSPDASSAASLSIRSGITPAPDKRAQKVRYNLRSKITHTNVDSMLEQIGNRGTADLAADRQSESSLDLVWRCKCGKKFKSEFTEYTKGGIAELVARVGEANGTKIVSTPSSADSSSRSSVPQSLIFPAKKIHAKLTTLFKRNEEQRSWIPLHSTNAAAAHSRPGTPSQQQILHLLVCMNAGSNHKSLHQDRIETIADDDTLFYFLRQQFSRFRGPIRTFLSLKTVTGIYFIKLRLHVGGSIEIRHHNPCCTSSPCECIPPKSRVEPSPQAEYRCIPGPPKVWPPIEPQYLAHLFTSPCCRDKNNTWILDQLPKRICGELQSKAGQPAEGWGIYYHESWDRDAITIVIFVVFLAASMLFGVLWSKFKMDVQGAFGVSAYMITACGILISLVSMRADKV